VSSFLRSSRRRLESELPPSPERRFFSPVAYGQYQVTMGLVRKYARGALIDLGCGDMPFKAWVSTQVTTYDSLDFFPRSAEVTYVADIQDMSMIESDHYDSALCIEVLEHVSDPFKAAAEIQRILKPGGVLVISVPHLSRLHDEPHDYYRYTSHGVEHLLQQAGFELLELQKRGGLFTFIGHQVSTVLIGLTWQVPVLKHIAWFLNSWLVTRLDYQLDAWLDPAGLFAQGYTAAARKPLPV
jgi:SAM-dependent methyltransferase